MILKKMLVIYAGAPWRTFLMIPDSRAPLTYMISGHIGDLAGQCRISCLVSAGRDYYLP